MVLNMHSRLNSPNHKLVYGMLSLLAAMLILLTSVPAHAAFSYISNSDPIKDATMSDTSWGIGPGLSNDYLRSHQDAWGQRPDSVSASMPLAVAVIAQQRYMVETSPATGGVPTKTCSYETYNFYWGSYMRWITDPATGRHSLQRTVGYDQSGVAIPGFMSSGFSAASKWPYHDDTLPSQDTFMYMNTVMHGKPRGLHSSRTDSDCAALLTSGYHGITRFNGTPVSNMNWTTILSNIERDPNVDGAILGVVYQSNVTYDPSYTGRKNFNLSAPKGAEPSGCNEETGLVQFAACKIGEAVGSVLEPIWHGIIALFVPDEQKVNDLVGAMGTFFEEKLGFLLFPFEIVIDLFNAILTPSSPWCNSSSCVLHAGNVLGGDFSINVLALKQASSAAWNLLVALANVGLVLALIAGIHRKFDEVTQK